MLPCGSISRSCSDALASIPENLDKEDAQTLAFFLRDLTAQDLLDVILVAAYSELFDRGRATSLLLFEHVRWGPAIAVRRWLTWMAQYGVYAAGARQPRTS